MKNMPADLLTAVDRVRHVMADLRMAREIIRCTELCALNRTASPLLISQLCREAHNNPQDRVAAITVHPTFLMNAFGNAARQRVPVGAIIAYPDGRVTPEQIRTDTRSAVVRGATEIEIVMDYNALRSGNKDKARAQLLACRTACGGDAKMKVVLETTAHRDYQELYDAACLAIDCGADMLVTGTDGNLSRDNTSLEAAAAMLQAIRDNRRTTGLKVAGVLADDLRGIAPYVALARRMMGDDWIKPENFRTNSRKAMNEARRMISPPPRLGYNGP